MFSALSNILLNISSAMKMHTSDYCDIETIDGYQTIVLKNRSMMTLVRYDGLLSTISYGTFNDMLDNVSNEINNMMKKNGHRIGCVFRKDLDAQSSLERVRRTKIATANKLKLDLIDLIEEDVAIYRDAVYDEEVYFALITQPSVLDKVEIQTMSEEFAAYNAPAMTTSQNLLAPIEVLRSKHSTFVEKFIAAFSGDGFYTKMEVVNVLDALSFIRHQVNPDRSSKDWKPAVALDEDIAEALGLRGGMSVQDMRSSVSTDIEVAVNQGKRSFSTPMHWPTNSNLDDLSHILPPSLSHQIMSANIDVLGAKEGLPANTIACGGRLYSSCVMSIAPSQPTMFNALFSAFNQSASKDAKGRSRSMPYSVCFFITGDGMAGTLVKNLLKDIMARIPPSSNENMRAAYKQLTYLKGQGVAVVGLQVSAMTWVEDTPDGRKKLRNRKTRLMHTMEAWGSMSVIENVGDPIMAWQSNILGLTDRNKAPKAATTLKRALQILPLTRPASPFGFKGTILNKTLDGKLMTIEKFSSTMNTWIKYIAGEPGSGKSVMLNNDLTETCLMSGLDRLPLITVIDKGISSTGFVDLLSDALPPHMRHLVAKKKLRKSADYAINPFDIKVGLTYPLESEKAQIVAFLTSLMTPAEEKVPYTGTQGFVTYLVESVFDLIQEGGERTNPKKYQYGYNRELDRILADYGVVDFEKIITYENGEEVETYDFNTYRDVTYFNLVKRLHIMGLEHQADSEHRITLWRGRDLAHRYAMPVLDDLVSILSEDSTINTYRNEIGTGETIVKFALRSISEIVTNYACFSNVTQFDVDSARVVALDLQDVLVKTNPQQSSLFYQIARMVGLKKISLSKEDIPSIPDLFKPYYEEQLNNLNTDRKVLAIDELHNAKGDIAFMKLLETDAREGRKWGLELILASQQLSDIDFGEGENKVQLLNYVTHLCICSTPKATDLDSFKNYFQPNPAVIEDLSRIGLSGHGMTYMSYIKAKSNRYFALMTLAVGHKRLWSLTTDQYDRLIRGYMYDLAGGRTLAIAALAHFFPGGAAQRIKEIRQTLEQQAGKDEDVTGATNNLVLKLAEQALIGFQDFEARQRVEAEANAYAEYE